MTKRYGALVGTPMQASPRPIPIGMGLSRASDHVIVRDRILLAAAPIADTISLGFAGWDSIIDPDLSTVWNDALGAGVTLSVGDITFPTALTNANVCTAAGVTSLHKSVVLGLYWAPLWQTLGYATLKAAQLIGPQCEFLATIGVGAATGNVAWQIKGQSR